MSSAAASAPARPPIDRRRRAAAWITVGAIIALIIAFFIFARIFTDALWFDQLGYLGVFATQWWWGLSMFAIGFLGMAVPLWVALQLSYRLRPVYAKLNTQLDRYQQVVEPLRRLAVWGIPIVFGLFSGLATASRWQLAAQWLHSTPFGTRDPQFHLDISFYTFQLPFFHAIASFASAVLIICFLATVATAYLYGSIRVSGRELRISRPARVQIAVIAGIYLLVQGASVWLDRFDTLTDSNVSGKITGAAYTDVHATIPARTILAGIAIIVAILFLITAVTGRWRFPIVGLALLIVSALVIGTLYPWGVQKFTVDPSEKPKETAYVAKSIEATRAAYGVSSVKGETYNVTQDTPAGALRQDAETTANIRIMDPTIVSPAFQQLQQFRQYYSFSDVLDVDRYETKGTTQDTVLAVRELDQGGLGDGTQSNWFNNTFVYTHGYGLVAAGGNTRANDGAPDFVESGIPTTKNLGTYEPRIYFGEKSPRYSIVGDPRGGKPIELDYPANGNGPATYNTYTGNGGPKLSNVFIRLLYALKFQDEQIVLSDQGGSSSQILYDRDPVKRVQEAAPFLTLDSDPYPSVVDGHIDWIIDGYTTSDQYPYSQQQSLSSAIDDSRTDVSPYPTDNINYIRNSVKATVDAYTGQVTLYAWDPSDPVLKTWEKILPVHIKPIADMSAQLMSHVRYPEDLFKVQREVLANYHVTDSGAFFSNEDAWKTPADPANNDGSMQPPYYLTMKLPKQQQAAYTLYTTFIPASSPTVSRSILKGYFAVDSDAGATAGKVSPDYGKFTLLTIPTDDNVWGPGQVQATAESDPGVSQQLNQLRIVGGSTQVQYGNLLTIPVGGGMLYVEPVYVKSTGSTSYPLLQKVIVSFGSKIYMESTLDAALDDLFGGDSGAQTGDQGAATPPVVAPPAGGSGNGATATPTPTPTAPAGGGTGTGTSTDNAALRQAIDDAQTAYEQAQAALKNSDWAAYGEAQKALQDALQRAAAAEQK